MPKRFDLIDAARFSRAADFATRRCCGLSCGRDGWRRRYLRLTFEPLANANGSSVISAAA